MREELLTGQDACFMSRAIALARRMEGRTRPNPPVGAVVVRDGEVIAEACHRAAGAPHAEIAALRAAGAGAAGSALYVSLEPCSTQGRTGACVPVVISSGVKRVVVGVRDPNPAHRGRGLRLLRSAGLSVTCGVCAAEAGRLIAPFAKWVVRGLPYVTLKMAMSVDGRIADGKGRSKWITSPASRKAVQRLRRRVDAILVGSRTALMDDPALLTAGGRGVVPYRVVLDAEGRLPLSARLLSDGHEAGTIVATTRRCAASRRRRLEDRGIAVWVLPADRGGVCLERLMRRLAGIGVLHVLCEGGGILAGTLVRDELVDEYLLFMAPRLIGDAGSTPVIGRQGWALADTPGMTFKETVAIGGDILIRAMPRDRQKESPTAQTAGKRPCSRD
ncbi:bifunctional diaminohydroxyphosphoribosylaminopyrimidine deaminase/5-amino-6-(5-phosphoribosylamino)uracil reductase RibD [Verrucomicrobiota bacterium]